MASVGYEMEIPGVLMPKESSEVSYAVAESVPADFVALGGGFNSLPDCVIYHILSFINVDDLVQLMVVSKRCLRLSVSAPFLLVDNSSHAHDLSSQSYFNHVVRKYFTDQRLAGATIKQLSIFWSFPEECLICGRKRKRGNHCDNEGSLVAECLKKSIVNQGLERLQVKIISGWCRLPNYHFFGCSTLRDLAVSMNNFRLDIPTCWASFSPLKKLTLQSVKLFSEPFNNLISFFLPNLKSLHLSDFSGMRKIDFNSKSLHHVEIINEKPSDLCSLSMWTPELRSLFITWYPSSVNCSQLDLDVPKLQQFTWSGFPLRVFSIYYLCPCNIQSASIHVKLPFGGIFDELSKYNVVQVFMAVLRESASLRVDAKTFEILSKHLELCRNPVLLRVETLYIGDCNLTDDEVPAIASCLRTMPALKNIHVTSSKVETLAPVKVFGFKVEYWEAQDLEFVHQLKMAAVEIQREEDNATELIKYLAKHGESLECLKIICPTSMTSVASGLVDAYKEVSTNVHVIFN